MIPSRDGRTNKFCRADYQLANVRCSLVSSAANLSRKQLKEKERNVRQILADKYEGTLDAPA